MNSDSDTDRPIMESSGPRQPVTRSFAQGPRFIGPPLEDAMV